MSPFIGLALTLVLLIVSPSTLMSALFSAPPLPSSRHARRTMIEAIGRHSPGKGAIFEIGAAWGHLSTEIACAFPDRRVIAYEKAVVPYLGARLHAFVRRPSNLQICLGDGLAALRSCNPTPDAAVLYLTPNLASAMAFVPDTVAEATVVNTFAIPGRHADEIIPVKGVISNTVFVYKRR